MPNKFYDILSLMRLNTPTGFLLAFFPAMFGLLLTNKEVANLIYVPLFFIGSIAARSAGCIINDILDQKFDRLVDRTKNRPLACKALSTNEALIVLFFTLIFCLAILLSLNITAIIIGTVAFFMILLYPLMKRLTYFPQVFLGITFNLGSLIAYAAIENSISYEALLIYIACGFWTFGYDTIYAFMDIKDDKKIGVKSTAIFFENRPYKIFILFCYTCFISFFMMANYIIENYWTMFISSSAVLLLSWQVMTLEVSQRINCLDRFKNNNIVGLILFTAMFFEYII